MTRSTRTLRLALVALVLVWTAPAAGEVPVGVHDGIVHLLVESTIRRYSLDGSEVFPEIVLASEPVALAAGPSGVYTGSGSHALTRHAADGSTVWTALLDVPISDVVDAGAAVVVAGSGSIVTLDPATGLELDRVEALPSLGSLHFEPVSQRIYGAAFPEIAYFPVGPAGEIGARHSVQAEAPGLGSGLRPLPGGARVFTRIGFVMDAETGAWLDHLHGSIDLEARGDGRIAVTRNAVVDLYDANSLEFLGRAGLEAVPCAIVDGGDGVLSFPEERTGPGETGPGEPVWVPNAAFGPRPVSTPPVPMPVFSGFAFATTFELTEDGVLFIANRFEDAIYRWSAPEQRYLEPIGVPWRYLDRWTPMAWDPVAARLLFGVDAWGSWKGSVFSLEPANPELSELKRILNDPRFIQVVGDRVRVGFGWPLEILTLDRSGAEVAHVHTAHNADYLLEAPGRILWHDASDASGSHTIDSDGVVIGTVVVPPLRGAPESASPDGSRFHTRAGEIVDAVTHEVLNWIPSGYDEQFSAWTASNLYTLTYTPDAVLEMRDAQLESLGVRTLPGRPVALLSAGDWLVAVTHSGRSVYLNAFTTADFDGDGTDNDVDVFPADPAEWSDRDGDGTGDNGDEFPDDPGEQADSDGDGVGDNADPFPDDASEWSDRDLDGVGDNTDLFPDDSADWADRDGDGVGDNTDPFPDDASESSDRDGDGFGDNTDLFPDDPRVAFDSDDDGVGDALDRFPFGEPLAWFTVEGKQKLTIRRVGGFRAKLAPIEIGLIPGGTWSGCFGAGACFGGTWAERLPRRRAMRLDLEFAPGFLDGLGEALASDIDAASGRSGSSIEFDEQTLRLEVKIRRGGRRAKLKMEIEHESTLLGFASGSGKYKWKMGRDKVTWADPNAAPRQP